MVNTLPIDAGLSTQTGFLCLIVRVLVVWVIPVLLRGVTMIRALRVITMWRIVVGSLAIRVLLTRLVCAIWSDLAVGV